MTGTMRAHRRAALADAVQDRLLAHAPVQQEGLDQPLRLLDLAAVAGEIDARRCARSAVSSERM